MSSESQPRNKGGWTPGPQVQQEVPAADASPARCARTASTLLAVSPGGLAHRNHTAGSPPLTQLSRRDPDTSGAAAPYPDPGRLVSWGTSPAVTFQHFLGGCVFPKV